MAHLGVQVTGGGGVTVAHPSKSVIVGDGVNVWVIVCVTVRLKLNVGVIVGLAENVGEIVNDGLMVGLGELDGDTVNVRVTLGVTVAVGEAVSVEVKVNVGLTVQVELGSAVKVGLTEKVGVELQREAEKKRLRTSSNHFIYHPHAVDPSSTP